MSSYEVIGEITENVLHLMQRCLNCLCSFVELRIFDVRITFLQIENSMQNNVILYEFLWVIAPLPVLSSISDLD